ncbi:MAG: tRNA (N6-threonylcarbamoyladenosine(37)-N6)-methyltransferase TrmO [Acidaminococcaceae bacterium]|nr:tRNA (N6-threonylcarbamoyladenosine(37)-N6)-methyltransferase TrmO [Acidaminococcaceae bacterium]
MAVETYPVKIIGHIRTDFASKFGVPRQSGLVDALEARIELEKEFAQPDAFRGLEGFSHLWIIWQFSEAVRSNWSATVRPPRLGGNQRVGVFATRSPFRPNAIGLSSVKIKKIETDTPKGPVIYVSGADLMDGTPILDIKPYLAYADSHPDAVDGFAGQVVYRKLRVVFPKEFLEMIPEEKRKALQGVLEENPAPHYQTDPERVYGFGFAGKEIKFRVQDGVLTVVRVE